MFKILVEISSDNKLCAILELQEVMRQLLLDKPVGQESKTTCDKHVVDSKWSLDDEVSEQPQGGWRQ